MKYQLSQPSRMLGVDAQYQRYRKIKYLENQPIHIQSIFLYFDLAEHLIVLDDLYITNTADGKRGRKIPFVNKEGLFIKH